MCQPQAGGSTGDHFPEQADQYLCSMTGTHFPARVPDFGQSWVRTGGGRGCSQAGPADGQHGLPNNSLLWARDLTVKKTSSLSQGIQSSREN